MRDRSSEHPSADAITRFTTGRETIAPENRRIVRHLLRGCPECRALVLETLRPEIDPAAYEPVLERLANAVKARNV